jgi:hypothetical protein
MVRRNRGVDSALFAPAIAIPSDVEFSKAKGGALADTAFA